LDSNKIGASDSGKPYVKVTIPKIGSGETIINTSDSFSPSAGNEMGLTDLGKVARQMILDKNIRTRGEMIETWKIKTEGTIYSAPATGSGEVMFVGAELEDRWGTGKVYALDRTTGRKKWVFNDIFGVHDAPAMGAGGMIYAADQKGKVYAFDGDTGDKKWDFETGGSIWKSPVIGSDVTIYFGSDDGKVYALDSGTKKKKWEFKTGDAVQTSPEIGPDGTIFSGSADKKVYGINGKDGTEKWSFDTGGSTNIFSPFLVPDGLLIAGSENGDALSRSCTIYGLDPQTGKKKWEFKTGFITCSPILHPDGTLLVGSHNGKVQALDPKTGGEKWELDMEGTVTSLALDQSGENLYILDTLWHEGRAEQYSNIVAIDPGAHKKKFTIDGKKEKFSAISVATDNTLYASDYRGMVLALKPKDQFVKESEEKEKQERARRGNLSIERGKDTIKIGGVTLPVRSPGEGTQA